MSYFTSKIGKEFLGPYTILSNKRDSPSEEKNNANFF